MDIPKKKIVCSVLFIHLIFLFIFTHKKISPANIPSKIHVKTYVQKEKKPSVISQSAPKKSLSPVSKKKKVVATEKPSEGIAKISPSLLEELRQNMDSISPLDQKLEKKEVIIIPERIQNLQIEQPFQPVDRTSEEVPYEALLSGVLKNGLTLPDYGEVKTRITLTPDGSLVQIEILKSKSRQNESYLKNRLPEITFPCFNKASPEKTLTITFKNQ